MTEQGFLSRWSRRKQQARRTKLALERAAASGSIATSPDNLPAQAEPELAPEELAELPRLEELTPDSEFTGFLRKGVPIALRNAALRRLWALDPKIRDHVGEARDYAYDWNQPGGVPGSGPLAEQDIEGLLRRVTGDTEPPVPPAAPKAAPRPVAESGADADAVSRAQNADGSAVGFDSVQPPAGEAEPRSPPEDEPAPVPRRHGGAMPG
jgi:hypothetical protein